MTIEKFVRIAKLDEINQEKEDLAYWLSRTPQERLSQVEMSWQQRHGNDEGLQRIARVVHIRKLGQKPFDAKTA